MRNRGGVASDTIKKQHLFCNLGSSFFNHFVYCGRMVSASTITIRNSEFGMRNGRWCRKRHIYNAKRSFATLIIHFSLFIIH